MRLATLRGLGIPFLAFSILLEVLAWRLSHIDPHVESFFLNDTSLWYTRTPETVHRWQIIAAGFLLSPVLFFIGEYTISREQRRNETRTSLAASWSWVSWRVAAHLIGTTTGFLLSAFLAECGKLSVGMLRPDFYYRCMGSSLPSSFPNNVVMSNDQCTQSDLELILNGRKSFPSEHACAGASFGWYLTLYLMWISWYIMQSRPFVSELVRMSSVIPFFFSLWIGVSHVFSHCCLLLMQPLLGH